MFGKSYGFALREGRLQPQLAHGCRIVGLEDDNKRATEGLPEALVCNESTEFYA